MVRYRNTISMLSNDVLYHRTTFNIERENLGHKNSQEQQLLTNDETVYLLYYFHLNTSYYN